MRKVRACKVCSDKRAAPQLAADELLVFQLEVGEITAVQNAVNKAEINRRECATLSKVNADELASIEGHVRKSRVRHLGRNELACLKRDIL